MMGSVCQGALNTLLLQGVCSHLGLTPELLGTLHQTLCVQDEQRLPACEQTHGGDAASVPNTGLQEIGWKRRRQNNKAPHFLSLFI